MVRGERLSHDIFGRSVMNFVCKLFVLAVLLSVCPPASAQKRVALVIGNSNYRSVPALPNPANDAAAVAATLKSAGFDIVESKLDLPVAGMRRALRDFADEARGSDVAVIYYAGHGIEMEGTNYLIPTDARLERDTDVPDELLPLERVLSAVEPARALRLVIVDACRNNPFADTMKRKDPTRGVSRGLARVEPATTNTLVAFAAKAGSTVLDGAIGNSPYAAALVKYIAKPGLDLRRAFGFIRDDVLEATGNRQEPYLYGSLGGAEVALVPAKAAASPAADVPTADIRRDLELAMQVGTKEALDAFLARYPEGYYADLARFELAKIVQRTRVAASGKAGLTEPVLAQTAEPEQRQIAPKTLADRSPPEHQAIVADAPRDEPFLGPDPKRGPSQESRQGPGLASLNDAAPDVDLAETIQNELRRVGCLSAATDGGPDKTLQRSLALFNKHAGTHLDVKRATPDALDTIKLRSARVCPLLCEHGFKIDGNTCSKIVCAEGYILNDDNACTKPRAKANRIKRAGPRQPREMRGQIETEIGAGLPQGFGKIVCNSSGCRSTQQGWSVRFPNNLEWRHQERPRDGDRQ
jgi:hypothetical protein